MTDDPRHTALAEVLRDHYPTGPAEVRVAHDRGRCGVECAAAILAKLPPDFCGHAGPIEALRAQAEGLRLVVADDDAEIARLTEMNDDKAHTLKIIRKEAREDRAEIARLREAVETEWYNGNMAEGARIRILADPADLALAGGSE